MIPSVPSFEQVMDFTRGVSSSTAFEDDECKALYNLCVEIPTDGLVVEIGCQLGRSSSIIAQVGKARNYHSVHIDPYTSQPEYLKGWIEMMYKVGGLWTLLCMRTEQAEWEIKKLAHYGIDLALIDGDHEAAGVRIDCRIVGNRIRRGRKLAAHDYGRDSLPGVYQAISEYAVAPDWAEIGIFGTLGVWERAKCSTS